MKLQRIKVYNSCNRIKKLFVIMTILGCSSLVYYYITKNNLNPFTDQVKTTEVEKNEMVAVINYDIPAVIVVSKGNIDISKSCNNVKSSEAKSISGNYKIVEELYKSRDYDYLKKNFFSVDSTTSVTSNLLNPNKLLATKAGLIDKSKFIILIYHTHSCETYVDSRKGERADTVVGVGDYLTKLLENKGYQVIHNTSTYDVIDGKWNRESYDAALPDLKRIIKENPSIMVTIDIHRNSGKEKTVTNIDGKEYARLMFFNGVCRNATSQRKGLYNPNLIGNLSFSLKMQIDSMMKYPDFTRKIYLKGYRYNLHLVPRAMLVEVGNCKNTISEAMNSMEIFAQLLDDVLSGKLDK